MLHGSETWPVRKENEVALQRAELRMVRWMCGVIVGFFGDAIKFIRHQTVLSGLTYLSRHTVTYLSVCMRSVT